LAVSDHVHDDIESDLINAGIVNRGKTYLVTAGDGLLQAAPDIYRGCFRDDPIDRVLGVVYEDTVRLPILPAEDKAAFRVVSARRDAGQFQGFAVNPKCMAVNSPEGYGMVGSNCIEEAAVGKVGVRPVVLVPTPAGDPGAGR
jgi:hypothetical protein